VATTVAKTVTTVHRTGQRTVEMPVATEAAAAATRATGVVKGLEERLRAELFETDQAEKDQIERLNLGHRWTDTKAHSVTANLLG